ncbi:MAG: putative metal-binding motif-containing protein, partial [Myxococcota bacterium]
MDCDGAVDEEVVDLPTWYADADEDTFGNPEVASVGCASPDGFVAVGTDCDDNDAAIYPGAAEYCADAIDNDCDGSVDEADAVDAPIWYADTDRDGFGDPATAVRACTTPTGHVADDTDCDDTSDTIFPGAPEVCDTIDNDCDTAIDEEGAIGTVRWFRDGDGDGYGTPDTSVLECSAPAGYVADDTDCNDGDRDLSPATQWHYDSDGDGFGVTATTVVQCASPGSDYSRTDGDCQPDDPDSYPGAPERCVDGAVADAIDNDCDGNVDETCPEIHCGTVTADETWAANANGHLVTCNVVVQGSNAPILTIDAGASVAFSAEAALWVGISAPGDLVVRGTETLPVTMTSESTTPAPGDWGGIVLQDDTSGMTRIEHATIEYAGGSDTYPAALDIRNASPALDHVTIRESQRNGLRVRDGRPLVTDSEIVDNSEYGILCQEGTCLDETPDSFDGNVLTGNEVPLQLPAAEVRTLGTANTFTGNFADRVEVRGGIVDRTATWRNIGVAYRVTQTVSVGDRTAAPVLTLGGGTVIEFDQGRGLRVGQSGPGDLATDGTATVILRSGRASPLAGDWEGITLGSLVSSATVLDDIEVAHGEDNIFIEPDGIATIDRAYLHHAQDDGLEAGNRVRLTLSNTELAFNGSFGARLADSVVVEGTVTGLDAHDNDQPLQIPSGHVHRLAPGSSFDGNTLDRIVVRHEDNLDADVTWGAQDVRYYIEQSVYVGDIATRPALTIADGARITFGAGQGIYVGLFSRPGDLVVDGDPIAGSGVTFD